ncbi:MAG: ureidoglycolate hydrolase [Candidatus Rokuibacteriota bacterium]|nr:MAG: ureidoglycolate hydrolase [Candidatus Rokubacteria bacterium]PYN23604.1 MAG: ureidoglycolate hydrolase [Candidatus Rokubacteria bacterium]
MHHQRFPLGGVGGAVALPDGEGDIMRIIAESLTEKAFAPYGDLLAAPAEFGRAYFDEGLRTSRATAWPSLSVSHVRPLPSLPLEARVMERHEFSSQSFLPLDVARWLVVVAPAGADGGPDPSRAVAFLAGPGQGVTYHAGTWHHPLTILDRPARFAVVMWRDGTRTDEEFRTLAAPFTVELPGG